MVPEISSACVAVMYFFSNEAFFWPSFRMLCSGVLESSFNSTAWSMKRATAE